MHFPSWMKLDWLFGTPPDEAKRLRLTEIETERERLKARIARASAQKKAHRHMWAELRDLTNEEDRLKAQ